MKNLVRRSNILGFAAIVTWILFTVSLVSWWIYFGISEIGQIVVTEPLADAKLSSFKRMLLWEGLAMIVSLIGAGFALLYYLRKERKEGAKLKNFFAAFTHEIKTPIAGARLKLEVLAEKLGRIESAKPLLESLDKVFNDIDRLTLQVDNSLFLADESIREPMLERLSMDSVITGIASHFPSLQVTGPKDVFLQIDRRILEAVLANIFNNAVVHGKATEIAVKATYEQQYVVLTFEDNGIGFSGDRQTLSVPFCRQYPGSGSGVGLFLIRSLVERLRGKVSSPQTVNGFAVQLEVPQQ